MLSLQRTSMARDNEKKPGLSAVHEGREARLRGRYSRPTANLLIYAVVGVLAVLGGYRLIWGRKLDSSREALLSQERAARTTVGAEWEKLQGNLEKFTIDGAGPYAGDLVAPEAKTWDFRARPGVYLRIRTADAQNATLLRKAAPFSVKDAFTGCLLREPNAALAQGQADAGAFAEQPWNLKQAYQATRVLTDEWEHEVQESGDDMRLRVFEQQYEKAKREEIPLAIDIVKKAEFYLFVLDEDVEEARATADGGAITVADLALVRHPARIYIYDLKANKLLVRLRKEVDASFRFAGERTAMSTETQQAMQRQVNNCALGQETWKTINGSP